MFNFKTYHKKKKSLRLLKTPVIKHKKSKNKKSKTNHNIKLYGTRAEVMSGNALQTAGGLKKKDLKYNSKGGIVSIKASNAAKQKSNLQPWINNNQKGTFKKHYKKGTYLYNQFIQST